MTYSRKLARLPLDHPDKIRALKRAYNSQLFRLRDLGSIFNTSETVMQKLVNRPSRNVVIGVDVDGVLRDFCSSLQRVYDQELPHETRDDVISDWDLSKFFSIGKGIWDFIYKEHAEDIFLNAKPFKGAQKLIDYLHKNGYIIRIISAQPDKLSSELVGCWLDKYGFHYDEIITTYDKEEVKYDVIIEDSPIMIPKCVKNNREVIRIRRPYNKHVAGAYTCVNYTEIRNKINELFN